MQPGELIGSADEADLGAAASERHAVFADVSLQSQDADDGSRHKDRSYKAREN
ncbi:MAG: hypothetical protein NVSMB48_04920 [Marmoricola sp.]